VTGFNFVRNTVSNVFNGIKGVISNIMGGLVWVVKAPINAIIGVINGFIGGLNRLKIPDWVPGVGGKGINIPLIPQLAKGGVATNSLLANIGEGADPEAVIPLSREVLADIGVGVAKSTPELQNSQRVETLLEALIDVVKDQKQNIVMDTGVLVGSLRKGVDKALQNDTTLRARGVTV
jgi:hypothetical protein